MSKKTYGQAIADSVVIEMHKDPNLEYIGEDPVGGAEMVFWDAWLEFPERFHVATITETANAGIGIGAAMCGMRMIVDLMYVDFMGVCMDEIYNQAANAIYTNNGQTRCSVVFRAMCGLGTSEGLQHSHSLEAWFCHVPGLKVIMPAYPDDAKGLFTAALNDGGPVIVLTHKKVGYIEDEVTDGKYEIPLGKAKILREGKDLTLISWSYPVILCMQAAEELAKQGIDVEVIDLRTLVPLDKDCILASIKKTGKVAIVSEENKTGSFAGEIAALIAEEAFTSLKAPIKRITAIDAPVPLGKLEDLYRITPEKIENAVKTIF